MDRRAFLLSTAAAFALGGAAAAQRAPVAPTTARRPVTIEQVGRTRVDDYAWLKDPHWKAVWRDPSVLNAEIKRHLADENAYASALLRPTRKLQRALLRDMRRKAVKDEDAPPSRDGEWSYFTRHKTGASQPSFYRRRGPDEQLLLDGNARTAGTTFLHIANAQHSPDHALFAWAEDREGSERFRIFVKDIATGAIMGEPVTGAFGNYTFSPDSKWLFWIERDENSRPVRVWRRPARGGAAAVVYHERDPAFFLDVTRTASNSHLMIRIWNGDSSEVHLIPAAAPEAAPQLVAPRAPGLLYSLEFWDGRFVVLTNADGAIDFKLMWADGQDPQQATWRDWIGHRAGRHVMAMQAFRDHFVRVERANGNPVIVVTKRAGLAEAAVEFDEAAYAASIDEPQDYAGTALRFTFETPRQPKRWMTLDIETMKQAVLKADATSGVAYVAELLKDNSANYVVERLFAPAADGETVPITLLRRRSQPLDGSAPLLLTGYGAYGFSMEAGYSPAALALVDRGWMWAIAHVRGGSEKGRSWYFGARAHTKRNSFSDFVACAEHLVGARYTSAGRIVAQGFSAGGLLIGAALNLKPELFGGVVVRAPFVDMLNTMSDAQHPLVPLARPDWGDPLARAEDYDYIASYSPYENVKAARYPAVLATTSVADDRVGYWEPAKWIAKLREKSTSGKPMLLVSDAQGGHGGAGGTDAELQRASLQYAFANWAIGAR